MKWEMGDLTPCFRFVVWQCGQTICSGEFIGDFQEGLAYSKYSVF